MKNVKKFANSLGAKAVATLPETGGGAFGAARLTAIVNNLHARLAPSRGKRPGRPSDASWIHRPKVPMSSITEERLARLAARLSDGNRKVSPMQLAAQLLEDAIAKIAEE
jgi:hypothetical protein